MDQAAAAQSILQQLMFVNSIMAGFALSIAAQLMLAEGDKTRVKSISIILFLVAAMAMLVSMFRAVGETVSLSTLAFSASQAPYAQALAGARAILSGIIVPAWRLGLFAFIAGVAVLGWVHSRAVGLLGTILAAATAAALMQRRF
jgi:hypothetical protein